MSQTTATATNTETPAANAAGTTAGGEAEGTLLVRDLPQTGAKQGETPGTEPGKAAEQPDAGKNGEQEGEQTPDPLLQVPDSPEGYSLTFAKGVSVDTGMLDSFRAVAHEHGITQGTAQKLADWYAAQTAGVEARRRDGEGAALKKAVEGWEQEIKGSPDFTEQHAHAQAALAAFGSPALFELMNETFIGSHPEMFKFVATVGKLLGESKVIGGGGGSGASEFIAAHYPESSKNWK